jgi:flagellin-like hook-associated protein FlgL
MAQIINTNISSLTAQRNANRTRNDLSTAIARLSSGLRINSAKDSGGAVAQATVYGGFQLTPAAALRLAVGRIQGSSGALSSTTVSAMLNFTYGVSVGD